jgi:hypothetical protein
LNNKEAHMEAPKSRPDALEPIYVTQENAAFNPVSK